MVPYGGICTDIFKIIMRDLVGFVLGNQKQDPHLWSPSPKLYLLL